MNEEELRALSAEEAGAYVEGLFKEGNEAELKRYFFLTMAHPYLCIRGSVQKALPEVPYAYYYTAAVAAREINNLKLFYRGLFNEIFSAENRLKATYRGYIYAKELGKRLNTEAAAGKDIKLLNIEAGNAEGYLSYDEEKGEFLLNAEIITTIIADTVEEAKAIAGAAKAVTEAAKDSIEALDIAELLEEDIRYRVGMSPTYVDSLIIKLMGYIDFFSGSIYTKEEAAALKGSLKGYKLTPLDEEAYKVNLVALGGGELYTYRSVLQYKKAKG